MIIRAKVSGDLADLHIKRNRKHDGKEATIDLEIGIRQQEAANWGVDFNDLAFSSMCERTQDGVTTLVHLQDTIKPNTQVVYERHVILIDGQKVKEQPKLLSMKTVEGEAKVIATVRVPVSVTQKKLLASLMDKVNSMVSLEFEPEQEQVPEAPPQTTGDLPLGSQPADAA